VETNRVSRNIIYSLRSDAVRRILRVSLRNAELESQPDQTDVPRRASGFARVS